MACSTCRSSTSAPAKCTSPLWSVLSRPRPRVALSRPNRLWEALAGLIVKYHAEAERAATLGLPVHVIANGVALPATLPRSRSGSDRLVLGTLAPVSPQKKLPHLLAALRIARIACRPTSC